MRIISGAFKGRQLYVPPGIRPTADRVKEAVFSIISNKWDISGIQVLDLFAGSGALGFEALSRGAAHAVFVDKSAGSIKAIKRNAINLGLGEQVEAVSGDAISYLSKSSDSHLFDLVFCDPPYEFNRWADILPAAYPGLVIAESNTDLIKTAHESGYKNAGSYKYGGSYVTIMW
jgi:16S rRNA (guanine966-N2)-methyltransferase